MRWKMIEPNFDFFGYRSNEDGSYTITKKGEDFLTCCGSEADAKNIVRLLNEDIEHINKKEVE